MSTNERQEASDASINDNSVMTPMHSHPDMNTANGKKHPSESEYYEQHPIERKKFLIQELQEKSEIIVRNWSVTKNGRGYKVFQGKDTINGGSVLWATEMMIAKDQPITIFAGAHGRCDGKNWVETAPGQFKINADLLDDSGYKCLKALYKGTKNVNVLNIKKYTANDVDHIRKQSWTHSTDDSRIMQQNVVFRN